MFYTICFQDCNLDFRIFGVDYSFSPPFQEVNQEEDSEIVKCINASSALILFVGLGCPKQEKLMAEHRGRVNSVMLGVEAAFDFHAGLKAQAPSWMQKIGLEWFYSFYGIGIRGLPAECLPWPTLLIVYVQMEKIQVIGHNFREAHFG